MFEKYMKKESRRVLETKIKELESTVSYLESENSDKQRTINSLKEALTTERESRLEDTYKLKEKDKELELLKTSKDNEIESLKKEVEYKDKLLKNYKELPDLKNMIDNLSTLSTPSIDKLAEIMKNSNAVDLTAISKKIERTEDMVEHIIQRFGHRF
jgi:chromosome segregation ATPase